MTKARLNGIEIDYEVSGRGPAVLLSHGYAATRRMWDDQHRALGERYRTISWSMRGHGETESPADPAAYSADLTVAVTHKEVQIELGVLDIRDGRVVGYDEKPKKRYPASMGIYVYGERARRQIVPGEYYDAPSLVLDLIAAGANVHAHAPETFWLEMGNRGDYERAEEIYTADTTRFSPTLAR